MTGFRVPTATYRIQFSHDFGFATTQSLVPYLQELGITDIYASPLFKARRGSLHGYSITNPMELNAELGSPRAFDTLARKLKTRNMGLVLDIVPNHMGLSPDNLWWMEVLEDGPSSPYAVFFDIDWHPPNRILDGKLLLPILGRPYGQALENQELKLTLEPGGFFIRYYDHKFPLDPKTYRQILSHGLERGIEELGEASPAIIGLTGLISLIAALPSRTPSSSSKAKERQREKEVLKKNLWLLYQGAPEVKVILDDTIRTFNGNKKEPETFDLLDELLQNQPYRLAFWQVALELINYRRFFSINDLIGIRIEDPQVFQARHALLFKLVDEGKVSGLRVDHIDGLYDPLDYLQSLQLRLASKNQPSSGPSNFYVVGEKILGTGETLPPEWPVSGTTGYDFLGKVNGLFIEEGGLRELQEIYGKFIKVSVDLEELIRDKKKLIMKALFGGEVENHVYYLALLATQDRQARDISREDLLEAFMEVTASLPIYRTYIRSLEVAPRDRSYLERSLAEGRRRNPHLNRAALDFLQRVLLLDFPPYLKEDQKKTWLNFVKRWQQFTGPVMAKGLEDTVLYIYHPLISLNEVGGDFRPVPPEDFHRFNEQRRRTCPHSMNATSTHDTKRSEDVRARLNVLSEISQEWQERLSRWSAWNHAKKSIVAGTLAPDLNQEVFFYQTMLGAWPLAVAEIPSFKERLKGYLIKAAREAMVHTRWISPQIEHENALLGFVDAILDEAENKEFLQDFRQMESRLAYWGALNSLSQVLLKIASPGVPDFYQGSELWDFSLVDPDNRRPVDFEQRVRFLQELTGQEAKSPGPLLAQLLRYWQDGRLKLYVTCRGLRLRRTLPDLFREGEYLPLAATGERQGNVVAFARRRQEQWVLAVAARFFARLAPPGEPPLGRKIWGESELLLPPDAPGRWQDALTGETLEVRHGIQTRSLPLGEVFQHLPVALLSSGQ